MFAIYWDRDISNLEETNPARIQGKSISTQPSDEAGQTAVEFDGAFMVPNSTMSTVQHVV